MYLQEPRNITKIQDKQPSIRDVNTGHTAKRRQCYRVGKYVGSVKKHQHNFRTKTSFCEFDV